MIYEGKISYSTIDDNGNEKVAKESYIVPFAESFGDAEKQLYEFCDGETDLDVTNITRSKLKEIMNTRSDENENVFVAEIADTQVNENGEEVELVYKLALFALNLDDAYTKMKDYLKQGYNMTLIAIRKTKIKDVIV